jgi:uncharacterized coiled-coil protein SlyX
MKPDEARARIEKLEAALAHLERQYDQLNHVVIDQDKSIRKMQLLLQRLAQSIETTELERIKSTNAKPPHYH